MTSLSANMRLNLSNLLDLTDQITNTSNRIGTGKKINSAADDVGMYFRAQSYSGRAAQLKSLVGEAKVALKGVDAASNALKGISDQLTTAMGAIKDARGSATDQAALSASSVSLTGKAWEVSEGFTKTGTAVTTGSPPSPITSATTLGTLNGTSTGSFSFRVGTGQGGAMSYKQFDYVGTNTIDKVMTDVNAAGLGVTLSLNSSGQLQLVGSGLVSFGLGYGATSDSARAASQSATANQNALLGFNLADAGLIDTGGASATANANGVTMTGTASGALSGAQLQQMMQKTSLIGPSIDSFQNGDTFEIALKSSNGTTNTLYLQAGYAPQTQTPNAGNSAANRYVVSTLADLSFAIGAAFGADNVTLSPTMTAGSGTARARISLGLTLLDTKASLSIIQSANAQPPAGTPGATPQIIQGGNSYNQANNLANIFGLPPANPPTGFANQTAQTTTTLSGANYLSSVNYTPGAATAATKSDKRWGAAATARAALDQVEALSKNAANAGMANLLQGKTIDVSVDTDGSKVSIGLGKTYTTGGYTYATVNSNSLGFTTSLTLDGNGSNWSNLSNNLADDTTVDSVQLLFDSAIKKIDAYRKDLANQQAVVTARNDFNDSIRSTLSAAAAVAVDLDDPTEEAANLTAMQTRQQLLQTLLSNTKQVEQGLVGLLR